MSWDSQKKENYKYYTNAIANIMSQANKSVFKQDMANFKETYEMYVTGKLADDAGFDRDRIFATYDSNEELFLKIFGEVSEKYRKGLKIVAGRLVYETEDEIEKAITEELLLIVQPISKNKSYVGCYADIDNDGKIDGIIFADLAIGGSGKYGTNDDGEYSYSKVENKDDLADYEIYSLESSENFGERFALKLKKGSEDKEDRFYVMDLDDVTTSFSSYCWYDAAYGSVSKEDTSVKFGDGKYNTYKMINMWNDTKYKQDDGKFPDVWGKIQEKVFGTNETKTIDDVVWFVPSKEELNAFCHVFNITSDNFKDLGMQTFYFSSSLKSRYTAFGVFLSQSRAAGDFLTISHDFRLATIF